MWLKSSSPREGTSRSHPQSPCSQGNCSLNQATLNTRENSHVVQMILTRILSCIRIEEVYFDSYMFSDKEKSSHFVLVPASSFCGPTRKKIRRVNGS